jgi:hypothetical protein
MDYCMALKEVIKVIRHYLRNQILSNRGNLTETEYRKKGWLNTETHLQNTIKSEKFMEKCESLNSAIPMKDHKKYNGVLSPIIQCLQRYRKNTVRKYIVNQFSHDEKLTTESIRKTKNTL